VRPAPPLLPGDAEGELAALVELLHTTEGRIDELTGGEVDGVADRDGRTFLLGRAQEHLRESDAVKQAAVLNALPAHIALLDAEGVIVSVNEAWRRFAGGLPGRTPGDGIGVSYLDVCDRARGADSFEAPLVAEGIRQVLSGAARVFRIVYPCHSPTERRWFQLVATPLAGDRLSGGVVLHLDITEQILARHDLAAARNELHHAVSESPAVIFTLWIGSEAMGLAWISENVQRLIGYSPEEALEPAWWGDGLHPDERAVVMSQLSGLLASDRLLQEYRFRHRDGTYVWLRDEKRVLRDDMGNPTEVVGSWSNITERKRAERRLLESEEEYRLIFDSNPHPMAVFDVGTLSFLAVNEASVHLYGYSRDEFLAMSVTDLRPAAELPALLQQLETLRDTPGLVTSLVKHRKKDGTLLDVEAASNPIEFRGQQARLVLANDVSERKHLEAQLRQAQKMEAVGRLAGGVAHDFNNSLGVILGYTELLLRQVGEAQRGKLEQILKATQRASGLTRQLLAFSRKEVVDPKVLDVNALLADLAKMLGRLIGEDVELVIEPGAGLGCVKADAGQLEQAVMNLCVNARDAMPDGGALRVETANVDMDAAQCAHLDPMEPGRYVRLTVSDTGSGIEKEILTKIFEPFFTTKDQDKGTGLGLAMVYGMVKQAGGYVWVESEMGRGTTFAVYLPRVDEVAAPAVLVPGVSMPTKGSETILLVEDEGALREIAREVLEEHGYRVIEATGPHKAIEICHRDPEPIDLLVTDVVMPAMNGRALADALVAARPGLRVLYMSGYTNDVIAHSGVLESGTLLLEKPFTVQALLERVRTALGTTSARPETAGATR
jgi:two-component system, cell cycle sensor histidine kinase and response regulator CckA